MSIDFDFSELRALTADLGNIEREAIPNVRKAVEVTARHIKHDSAETARRTGLRAYSASIDYDLKLNMDGAIGAEIGPNVGRKQGTLGFLEDAPGGVTAAPQHALRKAARKNEADFEKGLLKAIGDIL